MKISETIQIDTSEDKVWNTISSLEMVQKYNPLVTKVTVVGSGTGAKRNCDVKMGENIFQVDETLSMLDNENKSLVIALDEAPPPMKGLNFTFKVKNRGENTSAVEISTEMPENSEAEKMIRDLFKMMEQGLKKFHES